MAHIAEAFDDHFPTLSRMYEYSFMAPSLVGEARNIIPIDFENKATRPPKDKLAGTKKNSIVNDIRFRPKKLIQTAAFVGWLIAAIAIGIVATIATAGAMSGLVLGICFIVLGAGIIISQLVNGKFKERKFTLALNVLFGTLSVVIGAIAMGGILSPFAAGWIISGVGLGAIGLVVSAALLDATQAGVRTFLWCHKNKIDNFPLKV